MQWLIDIIKDWMLDYGFLTTSYVFRGTINAHDFGTVSFTQDGAWHNLDLSSIVPEGASAVNLHGSGKSANISTILLLIKKGSGSSRAYCQLRCQVANHQNCFRRTFALGSDRKLEYKISDPPFSLLNISVVGWWL